MCKLLRVTRSGFYAWCKADHSKRALREQALAAIVAEAFRVRNGRYGSPRVYRDLREEGVAIGRHKVARVMQRCGLRGRGLRRFVRTTDSTHGNAVAPNLLDRRFQPSGPNAVWATDTTFVQTAVGFVYLAVVMDLYSRRIVGWATSARHDTKLVLAALDQALKSRSPATGLLHHSDRGVQYTSADYRSALAARGIVVSMSRTANCWDNAVVESFFSSLKIELVHDAHFPSREAARAALFEYIETFYNPIRRHSTLGYLSPQQYEEEQLAA